MDKKQNISLLLERAFLDYKNSVAVISQEGQGYKNYTYQEIYQRIRKAASFFKDIGIGKNTHCLALLENRIEWLISYFGLIYNGAICVPLNPELRINEILNLSNDCQAKHIISSEKIYQEKLKGHQGDLPQMVIVDADQSQGKIIPFSKADTYPESDSPEPVDSDQVASLIYTSGTTGSPKGVLLTHRNLISNFESIKKLKIIKRSDNILAFLPLYHAYPFMVTLFVPFFSGAKITYFKVSLRKEVIFGTIKDTGVTILVAIPQFYQKLHTGISEKINSIPRIIRSFVFPIIKQKIRKGLGKSLRLLVCGGARLDKEVSQGFKKLGFNLVEGYGLTETSPIATFNRPGKVKFGSVGNVIPGVNLRIDKPNESGTGEICLQGPNLMKGYFRRPDLTNEVVKDGWFYTGDLGYLDKDGYLFITGRKKEVIVLSSGKNIYPLDIEEVYLESPYIKEICVMSGKKDDKSGEFLFAVVVPDLEYCRQKNEADIKGKIRWQIEEISITLPIYQRIQNFVLTQEELPKTALGKLKRYQIKEKYLDKSIRTKEEKKSSPEFDSEIGDKKTAELIINFLSQTLKKEVYLDHHLELDLEVDSLSRVELATELESKFSLKLPEDFFLKVSTVRELILEVLKFRNQGQPEGLSSQDWKKILEKDPPDSIKSKLKVKTTPFDILFTYAMKSMLFCFFKLFLRFKIHNKENIPKNKPFIICANHAAYFDGFLIFAANHLKHSTETFFIGYRDIFELSAFRWAIRFARLIPIDATTRLLDSMRAAAYVLANDQILCLFPEGERTPDGKIRPFKKGIGILLKELEVEVLPVYIKGAYQSWPRGQFLPRPHQVEIFFGKPLNYKQLLARHNLEGQDEYANISKALHLQVESLMNQS